MKKESAAKKDKSVTTRSSIAVSAETVCEDEACIGKMVTASSASTQEPVKAAEKPTRQPGSAMSFGGQEGCTDEACIGKT